MSYERLAYVYDLLMADVPYHKWLQFMLAEKEKRRVAGKRVLDLACGTGELSLLLAKSGFHVTGVDLSEDMLHVAREKAVNEEVDIILYEQDMSELDGLGKYDIITIFCDSLNYLSSPDQVRHTFRHVEQHLEDDGLFLFDVHSPYHMKHNYMNETFTLNEEEVAYIWNSFPGEYPYAVEHELTFFVFDEQSRKYDRFEELHKQRTYRIEDYESWLAEAGFVIHSVTADFTDLSPTNTSERIFFSCKKNKQ